MKNKQFVQIKKKLCINNVFSKFFLFKKKLMTYLKTGFLYLDWTKIMVLNIIFSLIRITKS